MRNKSRDIWNFSKNSQKVQDIIIETKLWCQIYSLWIQSYLVPPKKIRLGPPQKMYPFPAFLAADPWNQDPAPRPNPTGTGMQPATNPVQVASVRLGRSERLIFDGNSPQIPPLPVVSCFFFQMKFKWHFKWFIMVHQFQGCLFLDKNMYPVSYTLSCFSRKKYNYIYHII